MAIKDIEELNKIVENFVNERDWDKFHTPKNLAIGLNVEAGELLELFQWLTDKQVNELPNEKIEKIEEELADILIYLTRLSKKLDIDLLQAAEKKLLKNSEKYPAELVRGSAKKYNEY